MTSLDIFELIFISAIVIIGFGGMAYVILDKKKKGD